MYRQGGPATLWGHPVMFWRGIAPLDAQDYFFQAGLCHLAAGDQIAYKRAIERYQDQDVSFA